MADPSKGDYGSITVTSTPTASRTLVEGLASMQASVLLLEGLKHLEDPSPVPQCLRDVQIQKCPMISCLRPFGPGMTHLFVDSCGALSSVQDLDWTSMPSLELLCIRNCALDVPLHPSVLRLSRLQRLDLSGNRLVQLISEDAPQPVFPPSLPSAQPNVLSLDQDRDRPDSGGLADNDAGRPITAPQSSIRMLERSQAVQNTPDCVLPNEHVVQGSHPGSTADAAHRSENTYLPRLTELDISGNCLSSLPEALLPAAPGLRTLCLSDNQLTGLDGCGLGHLTALVTLTANSNRLASLPGDMSSLTCLESLELCHNPLLRTIEFGLPEIPAVQPLSAPIEHTSAHTASEILPPQSFSLSPSPSPSPSQAEAEAEAEAGRGVHVGLGALRRLVRLRCDWSGIERLPESLTLLLSLRELSLVGCPLYAHRSDPFGRDLLELAAAGAEFEAMRSGAGRLRDARGATAGLWRSDVVRLSSPEGATLRPSTVARIRQSLSTEQAATIFSSTGSTGHIGDDDGDDGDGGGGGADGVKATVPGPRGAASSLVGVGGDVAFAPGGAGGAGLSDGSSLMDTEALAIGVEGGASSLYSGGAGHGSVVSATHPDSANASMSDIHRSTALESVQSDSVHAAWQPRSDALLHGAAPARHGGLGKTIGGVSLTDEEEATAKSWAYVRPAEEQAILAPGQAQAVPLSGWGWAAGSQQT